MLIRTQIMLDHQTKRDLEYLSQVKNQSMSSLVRQFVAEKVQVEKKIMNKSKKIMGVRYRIAVVQQYCWALP